MANSGITWGKPLVEYGLTGEEDAAPSSFKAMPTAEENTVLLTTVKGSANELYGEGHELVARKMQKSYKQLAMSVFIPSGTDDPIPEEDGVIKDALLQKMIRWKDLSCVNVLLKSKKNGLPQRVNS